MSQAAATIDYTARYNFILDRIHQNTPHDEIAKAVKMEFGDYIEPTTIRMVIYRAKKKNDVRVAHLVNSRRKVNSDFNRSFFSKSSRKPPRQLPLDEEVQRFRATALLLTETTSRSQCRFPLNSDPHQMWVCGQQTLETGPYCQHHFRVCYESPAERERRLSHGHKEKRSD